jgi:hypothetical protein
METETPPSRRRWLKHAGALSLAAAVPGWAPAKSGDVRLAAAWDADGRHHVGVLAAEAGRMRVLASIEVPTRAHGLHVEAGGTLLAAARRPGDWLLRWSPAGGNAQWLWSEPDRRFNGHVLPDVSGRRLFSVETDLESGASFIGVRDARSLEKQAEWPTHGFDAHQLVHDGEGRLLVANGGVPTLPETGRVKRGLDRMDPSLVRVDAARGELLGQWRLADPRLSIRHLARHPDGVLGIALQAEHDEAEAKARAPVLALFDGKALRTAEAPQALAGYGGDVVATAMGFVVSVPRAGGLARWDALGRWLGLQPLDEACALAAEPSSAGAYLWAGGRDRVLEMPPTGESEAHALALRVDNHWRVLPDRG